MSSLPLHPERVPTRANAAAPAAATPCLDRLRPGERDALLRWLDAGLRDGRPGRIAAEYGAALAEAEPSDHVIARVAGRLAAHALARPVVLQAGGVALRAGMIGLVYADPAHRGRGLGSACVEAAAERLAARGALVAMLWSDRESFYRRLGYTPEGCESLFRIDGPVVARLRSHLSPLPPVRLARPSDFPVLETLYAAKPARVLRAPGALERAARAPECELRVACTADEPIAYAARGRGDDFRGVVHEWAGDPKGVAACLAALRDGEAESWLLASAHDEPLLRTLRALGVERREQRFALLRVLDAAGLDATLAARPGLSLDAFFVWGFDSI